MKRIRQFEVFPFAFDVFARKSNRHEKVRIKKMHQDKTNLVA